MEFYWLAMDLLVLLLLGSSKSPTGSLRTRGALAGEKKVITKSAAATMFAELTPWFPL